MASAGFPKIRATMSGLSKKFSGLPAENWQRASTVLFGPKKRNRYRITYNLQAMPKACMGLLYVSRA
jgi:hypothetical protein